MEQVKFVDLGAQYKNLREEIIRLFNDISERGDYILANEVRCFEENIARYCNTSYAIGVANGTDALFLALKAAGIKQGDEVITAPNSFIATAGAIVAAGARPVFVDVADDLNINAELVERAITEKTKAIMPVHLTGRPADMDAIMAIAKKHSLAVIEDAAQAIGAKYRSRHVGSFGNAGCFSLHPLKNLHVHGDGGLITTNDARIYETISKLRNHGLKNRDECNFFGYNSRLDSIQAAIANLKLRYIDEWTQQLRHIAAIYREGLSGVVKVPVDKPHEEAAYQNFIIQCNERDALQKYLLEKGVETKIHYPIPIHLQGASKYLGYRAGDFPMCESQAKRILSLPIYPELSDSKAHYVVESVRSFYSGRKM